MTCAIVTTQFIEAHRPRQEANLYCYWCFHAYATHDRKGHGRCTFQIGHEFPDGNVEVWRCPCPAFEPLGVVMQETP